MPLLYNLRHETIKECHNERVDVRTIDVGIGHDDNLVVSQLVDVGFLVLLAVNAEAYADALDDVHNRLRLEHLVPHYLLDIENLTAQRQDGLSVAVASLLGRTAGRVTLDEEYLALLGVAVGAVGKFARESTASHWVLALHTLACLACCDTCCGCKNHLVAYHLGLLGVLLKIVGQSLAYGLLYGSCHFAVAELGLGLALKLWLGYLDGDYGCESFAEVLACDLYLCLLNLLCNGWVGIGVCLECTCQRSTETGEVCTALDGVDVVDV